MGNLLIVDDESCILYVLGSLLESHTPLTVRSADSLEKARDILSQEPIDVLVSDTDLPSRGQGVTLGRELLQKNPHAYVLGMSGRDDAKEEWMPLNNYAQAPGKVDFRAKPIDIDDLLTLINTYCEQKGLNKE